MTGVTTQVQSLKTLVAESSEANASRCNAGNSAPELAGYSADSILFDIESEFKRINPASSEAVYRWYQSPLARKIRSAEKQVIEYGSLRDFLQTAQYKDPVRNELIQSIVGNTQTVEFVATVVTEIEYAGRVHSGCIEKAEAPGSVNREQVAADITRNDKALTATMFMSDITAETAWLLRSLTTDDLIRYEAYTATDDAQRFYRDLITAVQHGLTRAGDRISLAASSL